MRRSPLFLIFAATVVCVLVSFFLLPRADFSERENRFLAKGISFDGGIEKSIRAFAADRFPFRTAAISLAAETERFWGLSESGGVLLGTRLAERKDRFDEAVFSDNVARIDALSDAFSLPLSYMVIPRPSDYREGLPTLYENPSSESVFACLSRVNTVDTVSLLSGKDYYRTDHHLNYDGNEKLYRALCDARGLSPLSPERVTAKADFYGSAFRQSGLFSFLPDKFSYPVFGDEENYSAIANGKTGDALYDGNYLEKGDKYAFFLGGNYGELRIKKKNGEDRDTLLVVKDSYANALLPYLCRHYDVTVIDPRYFRGDVGAVIKETRPTEILVTVGADTLSAERYVSLLSENPSKSGSEDS